MSKLAAFLTENQDINERTHEVVISERFKISETEVLKFKIKPMTSDEFGKFQKASTKIIQVGRKRETSFDTGKYNLDVIKEHCLEPNFKDATFIKSLGVQTPDQAIKKVLLAGEITELANQITALSGFDVDINEEIQEAKN